MDTESVLFGIPLVGLVLGAVILVFGVFQGGLTVTALIGGVVGSVSILLLAFAVFQASSL